MRIEKSVLILRIVLGIIVGVLFIGLLLVALDSAKPATDGIYVMLGLFAFIVVLLGPLWPSPEKIEKSKFSLPTDNPKVGIPLFGVALSLFAFYSALNEWLSPGHTHHRWVKSLYSVFGSTGVIVFWMLLGLGCLRGAYRAYKKV